MGKTTIAKLPETWAELGRDLNVPQPIVSQTVRNLLSLRTEGPMPSRVPGPKVLGAAFVAELTETITRTRKVTIHGHGPMPAASTKSKAAEIDRLIREKLDEYSDLLGDNLLEKVADELGLDLNTVRKSFEDRFKAIETERKIKQKMLAWQQNDLLNERAAAVSAAARRENERETVRTESTKAVLPHPTGASAKAPPARSTAPSAAEPPPSATPAAPEEPPDELEAFLRASWIAIRAGLPGAKTSAVAALLTRFPKLTPADADAALTMAYSARTPAVKKDMERRARALAAEHNLPPLLPSDLA